MFDKKIIKLADEFLRENSVDNLRDYLNSKGYMVDDEDIPKIVEEMLEEAKKRGEI